MHRSSPLSVLLVLLASLALGCAPGADVGELEELEDTLKSDAPLTVDATKLVAVADTNRDGVVDNGDRNGRGAFDWSRGAFVLPNIDDDDSNGKSDAEDDVSTGADRDDLATIRVALGSSVVGSAKNVSVKSLGGGGYARVYSIDGGAATVGGSSAQPPQSTKGEGARGSASGTGSSD